MKNMSLLLVVATALACESESIPPVPLPAGLTMTPVVTGLSNPLYLTAPSNDTRLFIVEQRGTIRVVKNGTLLPAFYLDIRGKLTSGGERGLLGMAFHPNFAQNGFFFINYTDLNGDTKVERYQATPSSDVADANSGTHVLGIPQPFANHNGGHLLFGPDGMLWIGTGDGGSGGDPQGNGQKTTTLLGKMLRVNVNTLPYTIPSNNPFAGQTANRPEIWGIGLRNPWRYSFDRTTNLLYVADVGQNAWEEIHVVPSTQASVNYGWNTMEGRHCYAATTCTQTGLDIPVIEYGHDGGNCSIAGGFVYRGSAVPGLTGHYLYSDLCTGFLKSFKYSNGTATDQRDWTVPELGSVLSFGEDANGELYILSANGTVYRIDPT